MGPNGAGKTTVIKMILGLSPIDSGSLEVLGFEIPKDATTAREKIGVVPQIDNLDPEFTVEENLRIYGSYFNLKKDFLEEQIPKLLKFAELENKKDLRIQKLSGGMLRRLTIARSMVHNPELIILDEPTTGLDPQVRHALWDRLFELKNSGKTLLLTTHYMDEAQRLCDEIVIMDRGEILDRDSPRELIRKHIDGDVVEIRGANGSELEKEIDRLDIRTEKFQDQILCYTNSPLELMKFSSKYSDFSFIQRPANLEDVFLKLTGRELKE